MNSLQAQYYLIDYEGEKKAHGPVLHWREAAMQAFRFITTTMRIKPLGPEGHQIVRAPARLREALDNPNGWFSPIIPSSEIGMTFTQDNAYGPGDIAAELNALAQRFKEAKEQSTLQIIQQEAMIFLRHTPLNVQEAFQKVYDIHLERIALEAKHAQSASGNQNQQ